MEQSESVKELAAALAKFQGAVKNVVKDAENPFFKSKYASLENVWSTIREKLSENGLSLSQFPSGENELISVLMHSSGEWMRSSMKMTPADSKPQSLGSAITYARRYAISGILGLATEDDDDGNAASNPDARGAKGAKTPARPAAKKETAFQVAEKFITNAKTVDILEKAQARVNENPELSDSQKESLSLMIHDRSEAIKEGKVID